MVLRSSLIFNSFIRLAGLVLKAPITPNFFFILGRMEMVRHCRPLLSDRDRNARMNGQINGWVRSRPDGEHLEECAA